MSRDQGIGILFAVAVHVFALFAFHLSTPPKPLPIGNDPIQVNLVAAAPETDADLTPPAAGVATHSVSPAAEIPPPAPEPTVAPTPLTPERTPPPPTPSPVSIPRATPPPQAAPRPSQKPPRPRASPPTNRKPSLKTTETKKLAGAISSSVGATSHSGSVTGGGRGDTAPSYRSNPQPPYPAEARRLEQQGLVLLDVLVSAGGRAMKVTIKSSSGARILDQAAVSAVRGWSFQPGKIAGVPTASHVDVPVRFRLNR